MTQTPDSPFQVQEHQEELSFSTSFLVSKAHMLPTPAYLTVWECLANCWLDLSRAAISRGTGYALWCAVATGRRDWEPVHALLGQAGALVRAASSCRMEGAISLKCTMMPYGPPGGPVVSTLGKSRILHNILLLFSQEKCKLQNNIWCSEILF